MVSSKLPITRKSVFTTMAELAEEYEAINLTLPMSDFPCPPTLIDLVHKYMKKGFNNFSPITGVKPLRQQIVNRVNSMYKSDYDIDKEVTVTTGINQAITTAINAFIKEGDEVMVFEPSFDSFVPSIEVNGAFTKFISLKHPDFHIDWDEVIKMITSKTRMIILSTPQDPTGRVMSEEDIAQLKKITNGTNIIIVCNENFEHIVFDDEHHRSMASIPELRNRCLIVSSFDSLYKINGWGIAYTIGPGNLMKEYTKFQNFMSQSVNTPAQYALAEFLQTDDSYKDLADFYQGKRNYFCRLLQDSKFKLIPSKGTFYQILDYSEISNESDIDFAVRLAKEYGVATIPLTVFEHEKRSKRHLIRVCFAKSNEILDLAAERLCSVPPIFVEEVEEKNTD